MSFELREHTADIAVEATGSTPGTVFAAVADGLAAAICEFLPAGTASRSLCKPNLAKPFSLITSTN